MRCSVTGVPNLWAWDTSTGGPLLKATVESGELATLPFDLEVEPKEGPDPGSTEAAGARPRMSQPVWVGNTIYFTSDREDGRLNLWSYDLGSKQQKKVTTHNDYDVL